LIIVSYSGGKDSLACTLHLLELIKAQPGFDKTRIQLWHQDVDGEAGTPHFMDWPVTRPYVEATGKALGLRTLFQWKIGGFRGEMLRDNARTQPIMFELQDGLMCKAGGIRGKKSTRRKFPQVSGDLRVRWCSAYLKIDVCSMAIRNDPALSDAKILMITGERSEESSGRSNYAHVELLERASNKSRIVHQWRPIQDWTEIQVWEPIKRWRIRPHPAYELGWGRVSCMTCIFGDKDQWASVRALAPKTFDEIARLEEEFGFTIQRDKSVVEQADAGTPFPEVLADTFPADAMRSSAKATKYPQELFFLPDDEDWEYPPGAFKRCAGPT
jgi:3'-phosphoadenosine 5'-phosphosulfate sulfotransferase (PAPS reductase)/FAD synthetase